MKVRFFIGEDGQLHFDFEGFRGGTCLTELQKLLEKLKEQGLNIDIEKQELKAEYYQAEAYEGDVQQ